MKTFEQEVKTLIEDRKAKYLKQGEIIDADEIKATFNREKETTGGYNGRQLLELIQNADDEKSTEILIKLNTKTHTLIIANKGEKCHPFSVNGIKSLLLPNLSSKNSNDYIGNKGLGFRSIINWSDKITINSNNLDISFSQDIAANAFKDSEFKKTELPILAIPEIKKNTQNKWVTCIIIEYKNNSLKDINSQIKALKPEILLFLKHLTLIKIDIDGEKQDIAKPDAWTIKSKKDNFPKYLLADDDKDTKYELKIAFNNELTNNGSGYLFSYFPTKIKIDMPFIVHGTFDLDPTRNQLNDTPKNEFILEELVNLIIKTAKELSEKSVSYKALNFLDYSHKNEVLDTLGFYETIDSAIEELEIYPCIDNTYRKKERIVYSNKFSQFIQNNNFKNHIPCLLQPTETDKEQELLSDLGLYGFDIINKKSIKSVNQEIDTNNVRAEFICHLIVNDYKHKLQLLTNSKNNLIPIDDDIYTPTEQDLSLPDYVRIESINKDLYGKLREKIEGDLTDELENITNIKEYNKTEILKKVITSTNKELKLENAEIVTLIKSMLKCLYENYSNSITISDQKIQLLDKEQQLQNAKDLYLSKTYQSGKLTEELFGDIFTDSDFLADIGIFDLGENGQQIEDFFLWLGVNKYTKFIKRNDTRIEINKFSAVESAISQEKFILWLLKDNDIKNDIDKKYSIKNRGHQGGFYGYKQVNSSILKQLKSSDFFIDYLLESTKEISSPLLLLVNELPVNYKDELFKKYNIQRPDIDSLLLKIGAVNEFAGLSFTKVQAVLRILPEKDTTGKYAQKIYIESFRFNDKCLSEDIKLFAKKGKKKGYFNQDEVFYSGIQKLPKEYTNTKAIFDYPRKKETQKIIDFFHVKNLSETEVNISNKEESNINKEFLTYFKKIKPYILAYRLENIENKQDNEVKKLQQIQIELCSNISCKIENKEYQLSDYDYLIDNEKYLIKVPDKKLIKIRKTYDFYTTFGNILSLVFDVINVDKFQNCIKDDEENIRRHINENINNHAINDAKKLLSINTDFDNFWSVVYNILNKGYTDKHNENLTFINQELKINIDEKSINYADLSKNSNKLIDLFESLNIDVAAFNKCHNDDGVDFAVYHQNKLKNYFLDNNHQFEQYLHKYCQENDKQSEYLTKLNQYKAPENNYQTELKVDYKKIYVDFIKDNFGFELIETSNLDIDAIYKGNKEQLGRDFEVIENDYSIRSLLYFEGCIGKVKSWINQEKNKLAKQDKSIQNTITTIESAKFKEPSSRKTNNNSGKYTQSDTQQNRQKKDKGDNEEKKVNDYLMNKYGKENVIWVSKNDKYANHDFKYKDKNEWWYVEVKAQSNNIFYISKNEKKFAEDENEKYKIFLVNDKKIIEIHPVNFYDEKFIVEAENFSVHYSLENT